MLREISMRFCPAYAASLRVISYAASMASPALDSADDGNRA